MRPPVGGRQIHNIREYRTNVTNLTHVAVWLRKMKVFHHYLVLAVQTDHVEIMHYAPGTDALKALSVARMAILKYDDEKNDKLDFESGVFFINREGYPSNDTDKSAALQRAFSILGEASYSVVTIKNCESFVTWALTGEVKMSKSVGSTLASNTVRSGARSASTASANISAGTAATAAVPVEATSCGLEIHGLHKQEKNGHISDTNFKRQVTKNVSGVASSVAASTGAGFLGMFIGQIVCPIPVVGGVIGGIVGGIVGGVAGRAAGSAVSGKIFDAVTN